jgi:SAM-dependent methyltransferase
MTSTRKRARSAAVLALSWASLLVVALAQSGPQTHPVSGRRIASVMGAAGAAWLDRPERESEEAPSKAIAALGLEPGQVVADVGAGSGYYATRLARAVGVRGRVYAVEIQADMLALIKKKVDAERLSNVELVLGGPSDPGLPAGVADLVLMVDVYHELADPQAMLRALKRTLKPRGRLVLIEFRKESAWVPIREEHKMSIREARLELEAEGYALDRVIDVLPWQHILVFRALAPQARDPSPAP